MASEPDWIRIQRKTFTRWCNTHLVQVSLVIENLEEDLASGYVLHQLVTILSQRTLAKANKSPNSNFQKLQNLNVALDALTRQENVKLVNISAEDIMNKNSKLDLGLIWTLILKYQISRSEYGDDANAGPKKALLEWANRVLNPQGVYVKDFTGSWQDGAGFCGLVNAIEPGTIDLSQLNKDEPEEKLKNMNKAFEEGEGKFGIAHLLDAEDVLAHPDELSVMSYVSLYRAYLAQATADASKCTAEGPGLTHGKTREKAPFTVITRNEEGERITRGGANVVAKLVGPDGKETKAVVKDQLNGTYAGHYEVRVPGEYELTILVGGKPIQDSPFHPVIKPSGPSAQFSIAYGPGVEQAVSGEETHFTIKSVDEGEKELTEGGHIFPSKFIDASSGEEIPVTVTDNNDGKYSAKYTPKTAGQASVIVLLKTEEGEVPIKGSPYAVLVVPGSLDLSNVVLSGEGLKRVVAGEKGEFFVQAKDSNLNPLGHGNNALAADLSGPDNDVKVDVVNNGDGSYNGSFVPTKIGDYKLDVVFNGDKKVPGAPFAVEVVPAASNADHTVASGDGLHKAEAGQPNGFKVEVRDQFDNPVGKGGDEVTAEIVNPEGQVVPVAVADNGDGTYAATYAPINKAGPYTVHVKLNGQPIKDAPFELVVAPSSQGNDPEKSYVVGIEDAVAGESQHPVIHSVDAFGNPLIGAGDDVTMTVSGPEDVEVKVKDNGDGTYTADYTPTKAGPYEAVVNINGKPVKGSPFTFNTVPSVVDAGHCVASGNGIAKANSGKSANFKVQLRDRFDNDITSNKDGAVCASVLALKEARRAHEYPDSSDDEGKEKPAVEAPQTEVPVNVTDNGDGTFSASYVLRNAGTFNLEVTVNGGNVRDAPFTIRGNPGRPHIPNTVVRGARKGKAGTDGARVVLKDAQGNPRHKGGQQVKARLVPRPQDVEIDAIDNGDGSYTIPYPSDAQGNFDMALTCGEEGIPGDYNVAVAETPLSAEQEQAIHNALPSSGATVANLLKKAPLAEREKLAADLNALKSGQPAAAAPVAAAAAPVDDGRAEAAEQRAHQAQQDAQHAQQQAQEAQQQAEAAEQRAQQAEQQAAQSEHKAQEAQEKAAHLADQVEDLKRQLADAQQHSASAAAAAAPAPVAHAEESSSSEQQQPQQPQEHVEAPAPVATQAHAEESSSSEQQQQPQPSSPREDAPESPKSKKEQKKEAKLAKKNSKKENKEAKEAAKKAEEEAAAAAAAADAAAAPSDAPSTSKKAKKPKSKKKK